MGCFPIVYLGWFDFAQVPIDFSLYFAMDFGLEQPPRSSYADLPSYIPYMSHLSTHTSPTCLTFQQEQRVGQALGFMNAT
jgi:hypothetical protein